VTLTIGTRIGPYEIVSALGAGGMGEVWKARDTRLSRIVAIKVLRSQFATEPDRLRRFEEEARAIAGLNHQHICQIYDVGPGYLVLEYIEGASPRGPLAPDGQSFVINSVPEEASASPITVILNWKPRSSP